ncbi:MAG: YgiQ family radical SAM protein, partial [Arcobacteraceae bacterium]|nr:YgiQ family radical SAM protein [Arcobacteraceae bacterium]
MFIPTTKKECEKLGWEQLDIILVSGDTYIDTPYSGMAIVGQLLMQKGFKVGIIAQPGCESDTDIKRLGEPTLFWGVSSGLVDSMVANYTALKKFRNSDDFTPGMVNNKRPDRATLVYSNLIRRYFKNTAPIVLGGIEASLRRTAHYDFWSNKVRGSILFDAKADILVYGMAEKSIIEVADALKNNNSINNIRGICYISKEPNKS